MATSRRGHDGAATDSPTTGIMRYADDFVVMVSGNQGPRRSAQGRGRSGASPDGPAPVGGEDEDRPTSTRASTFLGFRIQRQPEAGRAEAIRIHLPVEEGFGLVVAKVRAIPEQGNEPVARQSCCAGSTRCCEAGPTTSDTACRKHLRYLRAFSVAPGRRMVAPQTPPCQLEVAATPLPSRVVARPKDEVKLFDPASGPDHPLPLPGHTIPSPWQRDQGTAA